MAGGSGAGALAMLRYDATATLPTLPLPVLIVAGQQDRQTVPEASVAMQRAIPDADLLVLAPVGHMGLLEQHAAFAEAVGTFSSRVLGVPAAPTVAAAATRPARSHL